MQKFWQYSLSRILQAQDMAGGRGGGGCSCLCISQVQTAHLSASPCGVAICPLPAKPRAHGLRVPASRTPAPPGRDPQPSWRIQWKKPFKAWK